MKALSFSIIVLLAFGCLNALCISLHPCHSPCDVGECVFHLLTLYLASRIRDKWQVACPEPRPPGALPVSICSPTLLPWSGKWDSWAEPLLPGGEERCLSNKHLLWNATEVLRFLLCIITTSLAYTMGHYPDQPETQKGQRTKAEKCQSKLTNTIIREVAHTSGQVDWMSRSQVRRPTQWNTPQLRESWGRYKSL